MASSNGDFVFSLNALADQNSGALTIVINTLFNIAICAKNVLAILSIKLLGGLSLTKRIANFFEINFAVDWWCASILIRLHLPDNRHQQKFFSKNYLFTIIMRFTANKKSPSCTNPFFRRFSSPTLSIIFLIGHHNHFRPLGQLSIRLKPWLPGLHHFGYNHHQHLRYAVPLLLGHNFHLSLAFRFLFLAGCALANFLFSAYRPWSFQHHFPLPH